MLLRTPLNEGWKYWWREHLAKKSEDKIPEQARSAEVPGVVQLDLMREGLLPDLYSGDNIDHSGWIEHKDWWYALQFPTPAGTAADKNTKERRSFLVFNGLDTFATVWLNGEVVGKAENMFIPHEFEVTSKLAPAGSNNLLVVRLAALAHSGRFDAGHEPVAWSHERVFCRKAQMSFGWDIAPRLATTGIWRPVELVSADTARLKDVRIRLIKISGTKAEIRITADVDYLAAKDGRCRLHGTLHGRRWEVLLDCHPGRNSAEAEVVIENAPLWWPLGYGEQKQIDWSAVLEDDGQRWLDERSGKTGLRRLELVQEPQASGATSFYFRCNGRKLFITGLNWTPLDALFPRITAQKITGTLEALAGIGCNMLRVWGGGIYEPEHFYSECDRLGILIWQDFMMACAWYPQDDDFAAKLADEAREVVRSLRNHPCLALWAGDNENDIFYPPLAANNRLTRRVLSQICAELDPDRPYIPSSPYSPSGGDPCSWTEGDVHYYNHGQAYNIPETWNIRCRFMSEFGHLSLPSLELIRKYFPVGSEWPLTNEMWKLHGANTIRVWFFRGCERILQALQACSRPAPGTIEEAVKASQELQAEAVCAWIKHYSEDPEFGGFLLWNVSDCWPQQSDSVIDYLGKPKLVFAQLGPLFRNLREQRMRCP